MSGPVSQVGPKKFVFLWLTLVLNVTVTIIIGELFLSLDVPINPDVTVITH
jgi:hypothetical protein